MQLVAWQWWMIKWKSEVKSRSQGKGDGRERDTDETRKPEESSVTATARKLYESYKQKHKIAMKEKQGGSDRHREMKKTWGKKDTTRSLGNDRKNIEDALCWPSICILWDHHPINVWQSWLNLFPNSVFLCWEELWSCHLTCPMIFFSVIYIPLQYLLVVFILVNSNNTGPVLMNLSTGHEYDIISIRLCFNEPPCLDPH